MAKLIFKKDVEFDNGLYVKDGETIGIPRAVRMQAEKLDLMWQQYLHLKDQPPACEGPTLSTFERDSFVGKDRIYLKDPEMPTVKKKAEEAAAFIAEMKQADAVNETNEWVDKFGELVDFCASPRFVAGDDKDSFVDTPAIGNLMVLEPEDVLAIIHEIVTSPIVWGE